MRWVCLSILAVVAGCSSSGSPVPDIPFGISGTTPKQGDIDVTPTAELVVTFTRPADPTSVTKETFRLETIGGFPIDGDIQQQGFNPANVRFAPRFPLKPNTQYRVILDGDIRALSGSRLGSDLVFTFITLNPTPTVRPDQLIDLGDALNIPRFRARGLRGRDGNFYVFGGFTDRNTVTDTVEVFDGATRTFRILPTRMLSPRAEHTATLLADGRVALVGGVATPGGAPLRSTEIFTPGGGVTVPGPDLNVGRRWHGASPFRSASTVFVSGGFDANGDRLDTAEFLDGSWQFARGTLTVPTAQHVQWTFAFDRVYIGVGSLTVEGALYDGLFLVPRAETIGGARFRGAAVSVDFGTKLMVVGGDTPSIIFYDFSTNFVVSASDLLNPRRGEHTVTPWGPRNRFLIAGGFNIAPLSGVVALNSMAVLDFFPGGLPDAVAYNVANVFLPVPFAGHVGGTLLDGSTLLAGGEGDGIGDHSRRAVIVLAD